MIKAIKQSKAGLTLVELLAVLVIIGIISAIATVSFTTVRQRTEESVLEQNMVILIRELELYSVTNDLSEDNTGALQDTLIMLGTRYTNPVSGNQAIIRSNQAGGNDSAAIVISQRDFTTAQTINFPNNRLWPFNAATSSQEKFRGAIVVQIASDGYVVYAYTRQQTMLNPRSIPFD